MRRMAVWVLVAMCLMLSACGNEPVLNFKGTDITGAPIGGELRLTDHTGKPRSLDDFKGKVVVLFFGYTHCPDVCPTTMVDLASAMKQLGDRSRDVQVLFVTVDPERDTQALLAQYVPAFNPTFIGLTGSNLEIKAVADRFKVVYQKVPMGDGNDKNYSVDHSAGSYIFDRTGKLRVFVNYGNSASIFVHDIGLLLGS